MADVLDSYIMKLFDRSVDLAQFSQDTPLYAVCRAWIRNLSQVPATVRQPQSSELTEESQVYALVNDWCCLLLYYRLLFNGLFLSAADV